jgi:hypothetical protein
MSVSKKYINAATAGRKKIIGIISDKVGNYENHPFFVNKTAKAKAKLKQVGLPTVLVKKA